MIVSTNAILESLQAHANSSGVFAGTEIVDDVLRCKARDIECEAWYLLEPTADGDGLTVLLATPDRWLSESIESDLVHSGDDMEELLDEELLDLGCPISSTQPTKIEHYRSDDRLYTFRSTIPNGSDEDTILKWLLAYEATFHELGDMSGEDND